MGHGIAHCFAQAGYDVLVFDALQDTRNGFLPKITKTLQRLEEKEILAAGEASNIVSRCTVCSSLEALASADLLIEAIAEDFVAKQTLFRSIEPILRDSCIIGTNTSSLPITALAASCTRPERFIGIHFFNPAPRMPLVELVPGLETEEASVTALQTALTSMGKKVVLARDTPGFIVNRIARPFYGEALRMLEEQVADEATIDCILRSHASFKMGPFELMDLIGIDINFAVSEQVFAAFYFDPRYRPSIQQRRMVDAKRLGRKSGRGFYQYDEGDTSGSTVPFDKTLAEYVTHRILFLLMNEAIDAVFLGVASVEDIETAMCAGVSYPKGLLAWAEEFGLATVLDGLIALHEEYGDDRYRPSPLLRRMVKNKASFFAE